MQSLSPFSTAGIYCLGTAPPTTASTNSKSSSPSFLGSNLTFTSPYCPCPPDCFLCFPCTSAIFLIVSLYGVLGILRFTSAPNLFFNLLTMTSKCVVPSPETTTSAFSISLDIENVGSSSNNFERPLLAN